MTEKETVIMDFSPYIEKSLNFGVKKVNMLALTRRWKCFVLK